MREGADSGKLCCSGKWRRFLQRRAREAKELKPALPSLCQKMIPRALSVSAELTKPGSTEPLKLPGLVSALRPIKRGSSQLTEEAALLRRFTYKNKNQHKGCGWWRKIVEVDRVVERVGTELQALLGEFGIE